MRLTIPIKSELILIEVRTPKDAEKDGLENWSLKQLQSSKDVQKNKRLVSSLCTIFKKCGIQEAYAPNVVAASAQIIKNGDELFSIGLGNNMSLYRNERLPADGMFLDPGMALIMSTAGCPIIIAVGGPHMIVAHAGRDSLVDRGAVCGTPTRKHVSVVHAIVDEFGMRGVSHKEIAACMMFSIPSMVFVHNFNDPEYGMFNRKLFDYINTRWPGSCTIDEMAMFINLEALFINQAIEFDMRYVWAMDGLSQHLNLAHTRDGKCTRRRNLFVIKRERENKEFSL